MAREPQSAGGGIFLALAIFIGAIAGTLSGEPSIGAMAGVAAGTLAALLIWWRDRKRVGH